jgi:D-serine deaminase-like pyridoxal phosphate-dependent protein
VRSDDAGLDLGRRLAAEPGLRLAGVAAYEGLIGAHDAPQTLAAVDALLDRVSEIAQALSDRFDGPPVLTAGGTTFFARVARRLAPRAASLGGTLVLRRGCYVTHDHGLYARALGPEARDGLPELRPAPPGPSRARSSPSTTSTPTYAWRRPTTPRPATSSSAASRTRARRSNAGASSPSSTTPAA